MTELFGVPLVPASVPLDATLDEAADALVGHGVSTLAVLDADGKVVGVLGGEDLVQALFPAYLGELRHTAFAREDPMPTVRLEDPVRDHAGEPESIDTEASAIHAAERFLHSGLDALPVVERGRFVGMLGRSEFCRAMLARAKAARAGDRSGPEDRRSV